MGAFYNGHFGASHNVLQRCADQVDQAWSGSGWLSHVCSRLTITIVRLFFLLPRNAEVVQDLPQCLSTPTSIARFHVFPFSCMALLCQGLVLCQYPFMCLLHPIFQGNCKSQQHDLFCCSGCDLNLVMMTSSGNFSCLLKSTWSLKASQLVFVLKLQALFP